MARAPKGLISKAELLKAAAENRTDVLLRFLNEQKGPEEEIALPPLILAEVRNDEHQSLLHIAAMKGADDCLTVLLQSPKVLRRINARDRASRTALHLASAMGYDVCAQKLLEASAALDLQDEKGYTPLHLAVKFEWPETARALLDAGADPLISDVHGFNAVDMANHKGDGDAASLIASFARRRQPSLVGQIRRCLLPNAFSARPAETAGLRSAVPKAGTLPPPSMLGQAAPPARPEGPYVHFNEEESPAAGATPLSVGVAPLQREVEPAQPAQNPAAPEASPLAAALEAVEVKEPQTAEAEDLAEEFALFRLQAFFEEGVKRLEFEVEWKEGTPSVGAVKPGGEAARRGIATGDRLVEIAGARTSGKGREELLPLLKTRPLLMKIDREARVAEPREPRLQLEISLRDGEGEDMGLDVATLGQLHVAAAVRPGSVAWRSGVLEGDAVVRVDGRDVSREPKEALQALVSSGPQVLTVWRRPQGVALSSPWQL